MVSNASHDAEITGVQTTRVDGNFEWTLVRIYTDAGVTGTGEAVIGAKAGEYVEYASEYIVGRNPLDIDPIMTDLFDRYAHSGGMSGIAVTAFSGIGIALHDVAGKLLGVPAYWLLGGKHRDAVRVYCDSHAGEHAASIDGSEPDDPYATDRYVVDPKNRHLNARPSLYDRASSASATTSATASSGSPVGVNSQETTPS